jgi:hypothetical protein
METPAEDEEPKQELSMEIQDFAGDVISPH